MNRYNYNKIKELGILETMALLREQRNLIKELSNFCEDEVSTNLLGGRKRLEVLLGVQSQTEILVFIRTKPILLTDTSENLPLNTHNKGYYLRCNKIASLFQSCIDSGYLLEKENPLSDSTKLVPYYTITDKGSDLLHFLGFIQIAFDKYSKIIVFFWGIIAVLIAQAFTFIFSHWGTIWSLIYN